jgi:chitin disaccharide deacetylase
MVKLVINADDFGLTDGICRAVIELLDQRAVSSTTLMVAVPGALERCRRWGVNSLRGVAGVHLQLSGGMPTLETREGQMLADPATGMFRSDIVNCSPELIAKEWRNQIELAAMLLGGAPSHLDSHHGVHEESAVVDVYISLAREYGLPVRGGSPLVEEYMLRAGVPGVNEVLLDWTGTRSPLAELKTLLVQSASRIGHNGSIEVVTHPGYCDSELMLASSLNRARDDDATALRELAADDWLTANDFVLASYSDLNRNVDL